MTELSGQRQRPHGRIQEAHRATIGLLFEATNAFEVDAALALFTAQAVIDDPSVGRVFEGRAAIKEYLTTFFVGYQTATTILSMQVSSAGVVAVRTDFTGLYGHEVGNLHFNFDQHGMIKRIHADLEG